MIPIMINHDYSQPPVGYLDKDGKIKLRAESGITPKQLINLEIGYIPKKIENGVITEAELVEISLVAKQPRTRRKLKSPGFYTPMDIAPGEVV